MAASYYNQPPVRFSRRWWMDRGQTLLWVSLVTVLIWVYADMEFTQTQEFNVVIEMQAGSTLVLLGNDEVPVTFKVQGNRNGIDQFERALKSRNHRLAVDVSEYGQGFNRATLDELMGRNDVFSKSGLSIVPNTSSELRFELDRLVTKSVPVQFEYTGAKLASPAVTEPKSADIRCASSRWNEINEKLKPGTPVLRTQAANLREFAAGKPQSLKAPLIPEIAGVPVDLVGSPTVNVDFQIERITSSTQVKLNVRVQTPRAWLEDGTWKEYELQIFEKVEWQPTVKVIGPTEALEQLASRTKDIKAFIELNDDDKTPVGSWNTRRVIVQFPSDLNVELDPGENPTVKFKLVKR